MSTYTADAREEELQLLRQLHANAGVRIVTSSSQTRVIASRLQEKNEALLILLRLGEGSVQWAIEITASGRRSLGVPSVAK